MILQFITAFLLFTQGFLSFLFPLSTESNGSEASSRTTEGVVIRVIDGDTIDVREADGKIARIRYIGINTPELRPSPECGAASSTARNRELVADKTVTLISGPGVSDQYGRGLAYVYVGNTFVNQTLIAEGWASLMMIPPNTAYQSTFEILETVARSNKQGIWNCPE